MQEQVLDILRRTRRRMRAADAAAATVVLTATAALAAAAIELAWSLPDSSHVWGLASCTCQRWPERHGWY